VQQKNLDIYGHDPIPWSRALDQLVAVRTSDAEEAPQTWWLSTTGPDGKPHTTGVGAWWADDRFYFTSGARTRKSRNLATNPQCAIAVALGDLDLVVEGTAARVTDEATLERVAERAREGGWPATVKDRALTAEYSAPSAGPPPWDVYVMTPRTAYGVATAEPHGATRWRFEP
jgi:pyridoxine/pyridoxamine 5'-phosphate oxidase